MLFLKKTCLLLGALLMVAVAGCSTPAPITITATTTQTNTATATTTQTSTVTVMPVTLNISAASSLTNALNEVNTAYTQLKPWVTITPNYGSSGTLQTQIENGAPCDVFFSAAAAQMDNLQNENLLLAGSRVNLLTNKIVLIVPKGSTLGLKSFNDLTLPAVKLIAIGDPKSVPAGTYAQTAFTELGILTAIQSKFVLGANVTQVLQYVDSGNVDAGVVYSTDALSDSNVTVIATGPADVNATIVYPAAIIKASKVASAAQDYITFLSSAQARAIFVKYGFAIAS
ncbi:MAG: molybdate ABC transporter substrate-binding protein [Dehalococcoidales bacterium]|jgi:molybdate transport system substrate-binding protein